VNPFSQTGRPNRQGRPACGRCVVNKLRAKAGNRRCLCRQLSETGATATEKGERRRRPFSDVRAALGTARTSVDYEVRVGGQFELLGLALVCLDEAAVLKEDGEDEALQERGAERVTPLGIAMASALLVRC
jgi:hypothetical protein